MSGSNASAWDEIYSTEGRRAEYPDEFVVRFVNEYLIGEEENPPCYDVLDLGCGPGRHVAYLAREGFNTHGVDFSEVAVEMARDLCGQMDLDAEIRREGVASLSFGDSSLDCVIDCATIQHNYVNDIRGAISEVDRVLQPGGLLFWKARSRGDSFYGRESEEEPGTCVFHQENVVLEKDGDPVEKPTYPFEKGEVEKMLSDTFDEINVGYTERSFDEMTGRIAPILP